MRTDTEAGGDLERKSRVLLIDLELRSQELLTDGLRGQGYVVVTASTEIEALQRLQMPEFDAVVLTLASLSLSSSPVLDAVLHLAEEVLVIILTDQLDVTSAVSALREGVFDILQQPVRCLELSSRLQEGLRAAEGGGGTVSWGPPPPASSGRFRTVQSGRVLGTARLIGESDGMKRVREQVENLARFRDVPVLIVGETGSGKEVVAAAIHDLTSPGEPLMSVNCAAIPEQLFENELFGHVAGAFTGSSGDRAGLFEEVGEGTFFLDEVAEMPSSLQPKLLRVLQTRTFRRVGGHKERQLRARIVSATNRAVSAAEQDGMRSDLYFRLAGQAIHLPPLRERIEDVPLLARHFLGQFADRYPGVATDITAPAVERLKAHLWPGNVRELQAVVEQAAMASSEEALSLASVSRVLQERTASMPPSSRPQAMGWEFPQENGSAPSSFEVPADPWDPATQISGTREEQRARSPFGPEGSPEGGEALLELTEVERQITVRTYHQNGRNLSKTARALSIPRTTLRDRLKRYGEC